MLSEIFKAPGREGAVASCLRHLDCYYKEERVPEILKKCIRVYCTKPKANRSWWRWEGGNIRPGGLKGCWENCIKYTQVNYTPCANQMEIPSSKDRSAPCQAHRPPPFSTKSLLQPLFPQAGPHTAAGFAIIYANFPP